MVHLLKDKKSLFFIYLVISFTYCLVGFIFFNYPFSSCGYWYLFKKKKTGLWVCRGNSSFSSPVVAC